MDRPRRRYPARYRDLMGALRAAHGPVWLYGIDDDMEIHNALRGMETYADRNDEILRERAARQQAARAALWAAGADALPAVRVGLCGAGRWREVLFEFVERFGGGEEDRAALREVATRDRDRLAGRARALLERWGETVGPVVPRPRVSPNKIEREREECFEDLIAFCLSPRTAREMRRHVGLWDRRNFSRNYLLELETARGHVAFCGTRGPQRGRYRATTAGVEWVRARQSADRAGDTGD